MSRISFVSPPLGLKERYGGFAPLGSTMPSLALLSLAAIARKAGFKSNIILGDSLNLNYNEIIDRVFRFSSEYLAITATTFSIYQAHKLATMVKEINPKITTIIGGPHLSALPEETMEKFSAFDIGVINEGELTIVELLKTLEQGDPPEQINGIVFRNKGAITSNKRRGFIKNLDELPFPAWDLLERFPAAYSPPIFRFKKLPATSIVTSRGCPNKCIFCSKAVFGNSIRLFGAEYVFRMIELLSKQYGVKEILIEDDTFLVAKDRVHKICELILANKLRISWSCLARVDNIEENILMHMKKAGCWQIGFGIESGSQEILDYSKKGITLDRVTEALEITKKVGILSKGFFILGFPYESAATLRSTVNFIRNSSLSDISVSFMTPLPGSELYEKAGELGQFDNEWEKMNLLKIVFVPKGLNKNDLEGYYRMLIKKFYLRPKIIYSYLLRCIQNFTFCIRMLRAALNL